ncbi:MAG: decaprenyl-phosphate phosphoribosyltransferase [Pseudomonadota bacterium]
MTLDKDLMSAFIRLIRVKQWIKNAFVFAPIIFSGLFTDTQAIINTCIAFALFCLAASATYVLNDIRDIEQDRKHPEKSKKRPLANGDISQTQAYIILAALYAIIAVSYFILPKVTEVIVLYVIINIGYCFYLKYLAVIDIFTIASGFVLRVYAGAMALEVPVSSWMFITTLCVALYLAAIKRRQELKLQGDGSRKVLKAYTVEVADRFAQMSATSALVFYSLFVTSTRPELVMSIPLVLFGFFRYWFITETLDQGESPTDALIQDWQLLLVAFLWAMFCIWTILSTTT